MSEHKEKSNFVQQASILASATLISRFIGFLYRMPLTDLIGDDGNAYYSNGFYIYMFFLLLSSAGLPVSISKMVSDRLAVKQYRNAHQVFKVSLLFGGVMGLFFSLVMGFGSKFFASLLLSPESYPTLLTLAPTVFIVAIMSTFRGYFQGMQNAIPTAVSQLIEQVVNASFSILLAYIFISDGVIYAAAGATAATGIGALAGLIVVITIYFLLKPKLFKKISKEVKTNKIESKRSIAKELLFLSLPIIIGSAVFSLTNIIDMTMVKNILVNNLNFDGKFADKLYGQLAGKYNTITTLPVAISTSFAIASVPAISALVKTKDIKGCNERINSAMRLTMMFSIPAAAGIGVLAGPILKFLFPTHPDGEMLLRVGSISIIFLALTQITTGMLQGIGKVNIPVFAAFIGALIKIISNIIFISIPDVNIVGAVISTIFCYLVASSIDVYFLVKYTKAKLDFKTILFKPFFASTIMGISCYTFYYFLFLFTKSNRISVLISVIFGMGIYFMIMVLIRGFNKEDILTLPKGNSILKFLNALNAFE